MANIFVITSGLKGVLLAGMAIHRRLEEAGHRVYSLAPERDGVSALVQQERIMFLPLTHQSTQTRYRTSKNSSKLRRMIKVVLNSRQRQQAQVAILEQHLTGYQALLTQYRPELVICDMECPEYILYAVNRQIKVLIISHFLPVPAWPDIPIPNSRRRVNNSSKASIVWSWVWGRTALYLKNVTLGIRKLGMDKKSTLLRYAQTLGINKELIASSTYLPGPVLLFSRIPTIHIMPEKFDFPHRLRDNEVYAGPMILENRSSDHKQAVASVEQTLAGCKGKKVIVCALSSLATVDTGFINKLVTAVAERPDWVAFVGLGDRSEIHNTELPENVHVYSWLPVTRVLPAADCAVITAGYNTINECIYYGVPMLAFSLNTTDQNGCIARILDHQLGLSGEFDKCTERSIQRDIEQLVTDSKIRNSVDRMMQHARSYKERGVLEKLVKQAVDMN